MFTSNLRSQPSRETNSLFGNQPTAHQGFTSLFGGPPAQPAAQSEQAAQTNGLFGTSPNTGPSMFGPVPQSFTSPASGGLFAWFGSGSLFGEAVADSSQPQEQPVPPGRSVGTGGGGGLFRDTSDQNASSSRVVARSVSNRVAVRREIAATMSLFNREDSQAPAEPAAPNTPFVSLFAQPALPPRQVSITEPADGSPFSCPVCCNDYSTSDKEKNKRPHNYECGHTMCLSCIQKLEDKKCPYCNKTGAELSTNYGLEHAIDWVKQSNSRSSELKMYQTHSLCLKCMETYDPKQKNLFSSNHKGHESIPLKDKPPEQMKKVFWLLSVLKAGGESRFERAKIMLRMLLDIVDTYMQALDEAEAHFKTTKENPTDELFEDIKTFLSKPEPEKTDYHNQSLLESLLTLREFEVSKAQAVFSLARQCQPADQTLLSDEFFTALKQDADEYVPVGMPEQYLGLFETLRLPDEHDANTQHMTDKPQAHNWLQSWRTSLLVKATA